MSPRTAAPEGWLGKVAPSTQFRALEMLMAVKARAKPEPHQGLDLPAAGLDSTWRDERDELIRAILLASNHPIVVLKAARGRYGELIDFEQVLANPSAKALVGACVGVRLRAQDSLLASEDLFAIYVRVVESGRPVTLEICLQREASRRWFLVNAVKFGDGAAIGFTETTEHKLAVLEATRLASEVRQQDATEAVSTLAAGIAHDVNNILYASYAYTGTAESRLESSHPAREDLRRALTATRAASGLVRGLSTVGRDAGFRPIRLSLNALIEDYADVLACLLGERIALRLNLRAEFDSVQGVPSEIERVLVNLCLNARCAMPRGGTVTIATADVRGRRCAAGDPGVQERGHALLIVSDTGSGMSEELKRRLLERLSTTRSARGAVGLGLPSVRTIVERHGATIELHSAPDQGTRVSIMLPCTGGDSGERLSSAR